MTTVSTDAPTASQAAIDHLRDALEAGLDWPEPLLQAMSIWTLPGESYRGRVNTYLIAGEAFDWLLLAERLIDAAKKHVPEPEKEACSSTAASRRTLTRPSSAACSASTSTVAISTTTTASRSRRPCNSPRSWSCRSATWRTVSRTATTTPRTRFGSCTGHQGASC